VAIRPLFPWLCAILALWAFAPGLHGTFLFDDYVNLDSLGAFGPVEHLDSFLLYLTSARGDPLGRPIALLSFLLDGQQWPTEPAPFLRTNVLLHLLNGQLLMLLLLHLARARADRRGDEVAPALLGASLWMLHPLFLSTTLYVVQRECMLAATFVLIGMLAWLRGRRLAIAGRLSSAIPWLAAGSLGATALSALSKANGALLPLLLLVAECTVLPPLSGQGADFLRKARALLLGLPAAVLLVAIGSMVPGAATSAADFRSWTLGQRLLTEPRVVFDYLQTLMFPSAFSPSIFHDDFVPSTGLLHPWQTLPAMAGLAGLITLACWFRRKNPAMSFALLFFLCAHLMEGSVIPLELYFDHRNYLPAMPLFWPLAQWLAAQGRHRAVRAGLGLGLVLWLALRTHIGAQLWAKPLPLALHWAQSHPLSPRAQAYAAQFEMQNGRPDLAHERLRLALQKSPAQAQLAYNLVDAECRMGGVSTRAIRQLHAAIAADASAVALNFAWISNAIGRATSSPCDGLNLDMLEGLVASIQANPAFRNAPGRVQDTEHLVGRIALARGDSAGSLAAFRRALNALPRPETVLQQSSLLANAGYPRLALCHLNDFTPTPEHRTLWTNMHDVHNWLLQRSDYWNSEFQHLRKALEQDIAADANVIQAPCPPAS